MGGSQESGPWATSSQRAGEGAREHLPGTVVLSLNLDAGDSELVDEY